MAQRFWKDRDPLEDQILLGEGMGPASKDAPRQIIGIVGDVRDAGLNKDPELSVYIPRAQAPSARMGELAPVYPMVVAVRTRVDPYSLSTQIQNELRSGSGLPVARVRTMEEVVARSTARQDFSMMLLTLFAAAALVLSSIGIYGLMSYSVAQRTQELGIRLALGADTGRLRNMVVRQGMTLAVIGVSIGLIASSGLTRVLISMLFGVEPLDPLVFAGIPLLLLLASLVAVLLPALRATRVDPVTALRGD
jgi:predicted lysophospholipase L1 biosynthesis ABC-type transport system permease subunit